MPINVGDAVMTFMFDATQGLASIDQIGAAAEEKFGAAADDATKVGTAMDGAGTKGAAAGSKINEAWLKVARVTQENRAAQQELKSVLDAVEKSGAKDSASMAELAAAQQKAAASAAALAAATKEATSTGEKDVVNMRQRRESMAAIGELGGVTIPRGLRTWIAEMKFIGPAMEAAFSALAPILLISVLAEGIGKLVEWHEASEKLAEDWEKDNTEFRASSHSIKEEIDAQKQRFIELTQGPIAAYAFALQHVKSIFDDTVGKVSGELDKQGQKFVERGNWFKLLFFGNDEALAKRAGQDMLELSKSLQAEMKKAQDIHPENALAGMDRGIEFLQHHIDELDTKIVKESAMMKGEDHSFALRGLDPASLERERTILNQQLSMLKLFRDKQKGMTETEDEEIKHNRLTKEREFADARFNVEKSSNLALLALGEEINRITFEHGKESYQLYEKQLVDSENDKHKILKTNAEQRLGELKKDEKANQAAITTAQGELRQLEFDHQLALIHIHEAGYKQRASMAVSALRQVIASTREGSQQRIDAEKALLEFLKKTWGEENDAYRGQLERVNEAVRAHNDFVKNMAREEAHYQEHSAQQRADSELAYYSFLRSTAQISAAQLIGIQQKVAEETYRIKRQALAAELAQLAPEEEQARARVINQLKVLDEKHEQDRRLMAAQSAEIINSYYEQLGVKSTMVYMRERDRAVEAYKAMAASGTASYGQILQAQIKVLQAQIELDAAEGKNVSKEVAALDRLTQAYNKLQLAMGKVTTAGRLSENMFKALGVDIRLMGSTASNVAVLSTAALGKMFQTWAQGGVTVAQACEQMTAAILQSLAQYAFAKAVEQMALGFAAMSPTSPDFGHSGEHFTSAALWFAAGAATSVVAGAVSGAASGGSSGGSTSAGSTGNSVTGNSSSAPPPNPVQKINVQSFGSGALLSQPTIAMIGDSKNGGSVAGAKEGVLPLEDDEAMQTVGEAIGPHVTGGGTTVHVHVAGLVSPDNLTKVIKQIDRKIKRGGGSLTSSSTLRVNKRSS